MGQPVLAAHVAVYGNHDAMLATAAALQAGSEHPLARAVGIAATAQGLTPEPARDVTAVPGRGVTGLLAGRRWHLGSTRYLKEAQVDLSPLAARADAE
jgi:Cu+-exporting ATPase